MQENAWPPPFQVRLSQRARRILVSIHATRGLEIVTPKRLSAREALQIIQQHRTWIENKLQRHNAHGADIWDKHQLPTQIHLPALGQNWSLAHSSDVAPRAQLRAIPAENRLLYTGAATEAWPLLQRWFIAMSKTHVLPELHRLAALHADPLTGSGARWNHTRWGSCSRAGRINLSARLLWLEPREVTYLLHHELNHLHHFDHSPAFWQALEARLPGALALDRGIRHAARRASFPMWLKLV